MLRLLDMEDGFPLVSGLSPDSQDGLVPQTQAPGGSQHSQALPVAKQREWTAAPLLDRVVAGRVPSLA